MPTTRTISITISRLEAWELLRLMQSSGRAHEWNDIMDELEAALGIPKPPKDERSQTDAR